MDFISDMINQFGVLPCVVFAAIIIFLVWMFFSKKGPGNDAGQNGNGNGQSGNGTRTGTGTGTGTTPTQSP